MRSSVIGAALALGGALLLVPLAACPATVTGNASLVSGIFITPDELLNNNLACGTGTGDVYKYVAVAINQNHDIVGAGVFDCFAEGVFGNLPGTDAGALNYGVWIYAYTYASFTKANQGNRLTAAISTLDNVYGPDGGSIPVSVDLPLDGGDKASGYAGALSTVCTTAATWVATCSATSQASIQSLAYCRPLALETSVPTSCNLAVLVPDAGPDAMP